MLVVWFAFSLLTFIFSVREDDALRQMILQHFAIAALIQSILSAILIAQSYRWLGLIEFVSPLVMIIALAVT